MLPIIRSMQLDGIRKTAVILTLFVSFFVVLWCTIKNTPVPDGVQGILTALIGFTLSLYGLTKTAERISYDIYNSQKRKDAAINDNK